MLKKLVVNNLTIYEQGDPHADLTVVLLHGYGASGLDLIPLTEALAWPVRVRFLFPQGPFKLPFYENAHAWFPLDLSRLDELFEEGAEFTRPPEMAPTLQQLFQALKEVGVDPRSTLIGGFSQGAMMALETVLLSEIPFRAAALLSTTPLDLQALKERAKIKQGIPFFQSHGRFDRLLPYEPAEQLFKVLSLDGWPGTFCSFEGGHEIDPVCLEQFEAFIHALL